MQVAFLEEDITIQSIKIYAPNDEEKQEINVISNAYIDDQLKILHLLILLHQLVISLTSLWCRKYG